MAAAIHKELGVEPTLVVGTGGVFEVSVHGRVVAQRSFLGFPDENEIVSAVAKSLAG